jgi:hypothetical protein
MANYIAANGRTKKFSNPATLEELHETLVALKQQQRWRNDPLLLKPKLIDAWLVPLRRLAAGWLRDMADVLEE